VPASRWARYGEAASGTAHRPALPLARAGERAARARHPRPDRIHTTKNAWPWFKAEGLGIFADNWDPAKGQYGAGAMIYGTFLVGVIALIIAVADQRRHRVCSSPRSRRGPLRKPIIYSVGPPGRDPVGRLRALGASRCSPRPLADIYDSISRPLRASR